METLHFRFIGLVLVIICFSVSIGVKGQVPFPPKEEVDALREIGDQLGKKDWDFGLNPCDNRTSWVSPLRVDMPMYNNTVLCNCTIDNVCHITHIMLKGQDLPGVLPPSLAKLPYIIYVDFWANYLNGTIPKEWGSTKLEVLAVGVNRLSGPIPEYLGNITSLIYLSLENNMFNGEVPASLEKLVNLEALVLNTNNLTGAIPTELSRLTKLTQLRISSNNFVGKIPRISTLTNLQRLEIQGSGLEGPIPSDIFLSNSLTELRISDLNGEGSDFPQLGHMTKMGRLMLRSCNISGKIPSDILLMPQLQILDLSHNKLHGEPPNFGSLLGLENLYLTGNFLSGPIPTWAQNPADSLVADLSYNNFSESSLSSPCRETVNLFRSVSGENSLGPSKCLPSCTREWYSFYINCAGTDVNTGSIIYESDEASEGFAKFVHTKEYWGSSSTGHFWDVTKVNRQVTATNTSVLQADNAKLYETARLSPLSLTYYGNCLANGNYTVKLHFAEIIFTNNQSYMSLGRRIFDIYIQDELVRKDFNIEDEAGGVVNKEVIREFKTVVKNRILEIRFKWAGRGTSAVPARGNSGPLISAISVKSDFDPPVDKRKKILIIAASVACCLVLLLMYTLWWNGYLGGGKSRQQEWQSLAPNIGFFTLKQIKTATKNFDAGNKIGQGGFGSVYKGVLPHGTVIAVKQLSLVSKQGHREFVNEVGMISGLQHKNLVQLYGCCVESRQLLLVYEYLENNCLARALFGPEQSQLKLDWPTRQRICLGIAKGLAFLHEESVIKVVHRDIKATNVLLDGDLNPKISDFGLAKLDEEENTHITTRAAGTIGYMAPEYALWGYLTYKADVYSFGIVALEIVAGKSNMNYQSEENYVCLLDKALVLQQKGGLHELVDSGLASNYNSEEAIRMIKIALLCTNPSPALRPNMSAVVSMLEGQTSVHELYVNPSIYGDELKFKALRDKYDEMQPKNTSETDSLIMNPLDAPNASSTSASSQDHYSINLST